MRGPAPLESPAIYGGDAKHKDLVPDAKGSTRTPLFLMGFTFIEVIITISIFIIIFLAALPFYNYFSSFTMLGSIKQEVLQNVRLAQTKARSGENSSDFGVKFEAGQYTLYQGADFFHRQADQDAIFGLLSNIQITNPPEVNFFIKTGLPKASQVVTILNTSNNKSETITINSNGLIY